MANVDHVEQLHQVLQQSFSPDANLRGPAEETIRNLKNIPGSTSLLLKIASEKQVRCSSCCFARLAPGKPRSTLFRTVSSFLVRMVLFRPQS